MDYFRHAARMVLMLIHGFNISRRRYFHMHAVSSDPNKHTDIFVEHERKTSFKSGISLSLHMALLKHPRYKSAEEIRDITWLLRANKTFRDLFPDSMESELARLVSYERYDDGRVVAYQNRTPDRFYYVLSGTISLLKEYNLQHGTVSRFAAEIKKGQHTDIEELENQWVRPHHLVAKGGAELLSLARDDFCCVTKLSTDLSLDFLRSIDVFTDFPLNLLSCHPDSVKHRYYGRGQVIVADSTRTPWIIVVKGGQVKVVREQTILDLPDYSNYTKETKRHPFDPVHITTEGETVLKNMQKMQMKNKFQQTEKKVNIGDRVQAITGKRKCQPSLQTNHPIQMKTEGDSDEDNQKIPEKERITHKIVLPVVINVPTKDISEILEPFEESKIEMGVKLTTQDSVKTLPERSTFLQLDVLGIGRTFGFEHLHEAKYSEAKGMTLLSDGAEVILISKHFFLSQADNNTMLKVMKMFKEYMSVKEAKDSMCRRANWSQYKNTILQDAIHDVTKPLHR